MPLKELVSDPKVIVDNRQMGRAASSDSDEVHEPTETYLVCRLGNDSQIAADALRSAGIAGVVKDLVGGLRAWSAEADPDFPVY